MEWISELGAFLWAVINNWAGYTTGGVVVALLWLWSTLKQIPISRKFGIGIALIFLFFAIFNAWRERNHAALDAERKLEELTIPKLDGHIDRVYVAPAHDGKDSI